MNAFRLNTYKMSAVIFVGTILRYRNILFWWYDFETIGQCFSVNIEIAARQAHSGCVNFDSFVFVCVGAMEFDGKELLAIMRRDIILFRIQSINRNKIVIFWANAMEGIIYTVSNRAMTMTMKMKVEHKHHVSYRWTKVSYAYTSA